MVGSIYGGSLFAVTDGVHPMMLMSALGEDGWELVFARRASDGGDAMMYEVILKRAK